MRNRGGPCAKVFNRLRLLYDFCPRIGILFKPAVSIDPNHDLLTEVVKMLDTWLIMIKAFQVYLELKHHCLMSMVFAWSHIDLPGFGESDPYPNRNFNSSAMDMLHLANAVNVPNKFWVLCHSSGCIHAWASLRYIPERMSRYLDVLIINPASGKCLEVITN
ncbi:hypothetical protein E2542_SST12035 [Spatholobus suberectus]|nr:hypothetical protein E2542_SST12035 [Spatholobus suberectus]